MGSRHSSHRCAALPTQSRREATHPCGTPTMAGRLHTPVVHPPWQGGMYAPHGTVSHGREAYMRLRIPLLHGWEAGLCASWSLSSMVGRLVYAPHGPSSLGLEAGLCASGSLSLRLEAGLCAEASLSHVRGWSMRRAPLLGVYPGICLPGVYTEIIPWFIASLVYIRRVIPGFIASLVYILPVGYSLV